jgi:recombination protein RecT
MNAPTQKIAAPNGWVQSIEAAAPKFENSTLDFAQQQVFAVQLLMNNEYTLKVAKENPNSLKLAMFNVAAIGLSLNPAQGLAYLVPRRIKRGEASRICLDISYRGLIAIGVDVGSIRWAKAELVFQNDKFEYRGPAEKPLHIADPFDDENRGPLRGVYCLAEMPHGGYLVETMSVMEINKIRDKSEAFKSGIGPWVDWESEMQKKTVIKRASKWWPQTQANPRLSTAIEVLNTENGEGIVFNEHPVAEASAIPSLNELPAPPPAELVSIELREMVKRFIDRAVQTQSFEACREVFGQRIGNRDELSFALNELQQAKSSTGQQAATH